MNFRGISVNPRAVKNVKEAQRPTACRANSIWLYRREKKRKEMEELQENAYKEERGKEEKNYMYCVNIIDRLVIKSQIECNTAVLEERDEE